MSRYPVRPSRRLVLATALGGVTGLAACREGLDAGPATPPPGLAAGAPGAGQPLGAGSVKVALILP
ncbi:hypothetical protein J8J40_24240, partial [Mycobacterium tuberculosis]|nr:hypothetical protein [Mycobacterium tuberculosis]